MNTKNTNFKDSKIAWIGQIPKHWDYIKLKYFYNFEKGKNAQLYTLDYIGLNQGRYPVYSGQTEQDGIMGYIDTYDYDIDECLFTTTVGAKVMTPKILQGKFSLSQNCLIMKRKRQCNNHFFYYYLIPLFDYEKGSIPSYMQPSLRVEDLKKYGFYVPPLDEQEKIANFLDNKCEKIDSTIKNLEQKINALKEYKKSLISECVTKGLNPKNKEFKDSGIPWIGQIPKHWEIRPLYFYFNERKNKNLFENEKNLLSLSYGKIIRKNIETKDGLLPKNFNGYNIIEKDDIVFRLTDLQNDKVSLRTGLVKEKGIITSAYVTIKPKQKICIEFYHYLLHCYDLTKVFYNFGNGVRQNLTYKELSKMKILVPPLNEQKEIAEFLDKKCEKIDRLNENYTKQITTLKEYKKSLIYECVTGKKDIKG